MKYRDSQLRIFISSTMKELRDARSVVKRELDRRDINAFVYEKDVSAAPDSIVETSLRQVDEADVYVGLFWQDYGKITIEEYQRAKQTEKPRFVYIRDKGIKREDNLEAFLQEEIYELQNGVTPKYFEDVSELGEQIAKDILVWLVRQHREMTAKLKQAHLSQEEIERLQAEIAHLQASSREELPQGTAVDYLAQQMRAWFQTGYGG